MSKSYGRSRKGRTGLGYDSKRQLRDTRRCRHGLAESGVLPAVSVEGADHRQAFHHELRHLLPVVCALLGDLLMLLPEIVAQVDDRNARFLAPYLEYVGPFLEIFPERNVRLSAMLGEILRRHSEGISLKLERALPAGEGLARQSVYFCNRPVGHCIAP